MVYFTLQVVHEECRRIGAKTKHCLMLGEMVRPGMSLEDRNFFMFPMYSYEKENWCPFLLTDSLSCNSRYPLIDANMKELLATGFMSNRGRQVNLKISTHTCYSLSVCLMRTSILQIVCSFLVRDMGVDWRMGAEWFESCLLDYDPCSNYGNWTYGAGQFQC